MAARGKRRAPRRRSAGTKRAPRRSSAGKRANVNRWSRWVTENSHAMDLEPGVFQRSPPEIAASLRRSVERSTNLKSTPFQSAMSMLTFYGNRAGRGLPAERKQAIHRAKDELRKLYGRPPKEQRSVRSGRARS